MHTDVAPPFVDTHAVRNIPPAAMRAMHKPNTLDVLTYYISLNMGHGPQSRVKRKPLTGPLLDLGERGCPRQVQTSLRSCWTRYCGSYVAAHTVKCTSLAATTNFSSRPAGKYAAAGHGTADPSYSRTSPYAHRAIYVSSRFCSTPSRYPKASLWHIMSGTSKRFQLVTICHGYTRSCWSYFGNSPICTRLPSHRILTFHITVVVCARQSAAFHGSYIRASRTCL